MPDAVPEPIEELARARANARRVRNWVEADRLRAELEAAGWRVVDSGFDYQLSPSHPPDLVEDGRVRYGSSASVPSRLGEPAHDGASVILVATDWPTDLGRALEGVRTHAPTETHVVVVANAASPEQADALEALEAAAGGGADGGADAADQDGLEVVWTSQRLGHAAALNAALRRAAGRFVILLDTSVEPTGDFVTPLLTILDDPSVGVAGGFGVTSTDLRHFDAAPAGDVDAVEGYVLAFRREDVVERGPLDERFHFYRNLDLWWSLVLRDEGPDRAPRRAVAVDLPVVRHEHREWSGLPEAERARLSKRNFYRIIDRFGSRLDLLAEPAASSRRG